MLHAYLAPNCASEILQNKRTCCAAHKALHSDYSDSPSGSNCKVYSPACITISFSRLMPALFRISTLNCELIPIVFNACCTLQGACNVFMTSSRPCLTTLILMSAICSTAERISVKILCQAEHYVLQTSTNLLQQFVHMETAVECHRVGKEITGGSLASCSSDSFFLLRVSSISSPLPTVAQQYWKGAILLPRCTQFCYVGQRRNTQCCGPSAAGQRAFVSKFGRWILSYN